MASRILIAPSILSADFACLGQSIREAEAAGADWVHIDVMDGHFVPNLTMGPVVVEACRRVTMLPLDVHLMVQSPDHLLRPFAQAGASSLTVHVEACTHIHRTLGAIHDLGIGAGVALNPGTSATAITELLGNVDLILALCVNPGYSGETFIPSVLKKIAQIRSWRDEGQTRALIQVDGGISSITAPQAQRAGADVFVAATAIFGHPEGIQAGLRALRRALEPVEA